MAALAALQSHAAAFVELLKGAAAASPALPEPGAEYVPPRAAAALGR
jgi:hypothetical protein